MYVSACVWQPAHHTTRLFVLRSLVSTSQYSQVTAAFSTDDLGHLIHHIQNRLLQRGSCRSTTIWTGPGAVCRQRGRSAHGRCPQIRPCDTASDGFALAAGATCNASSTSCACWCTAAWTEEHQDTCRTWQCLSTNLPHVVSYTLSVDLWSCGTTNTSGISKTVRSPL